METKTYRAAIEFKGYGETGEFEAVFATLGMEVVDHDGDVTLPGAFGEQRVVIEPWNHNYQAPPVGMGVIQERGNEAIVVGRFFMDTASGLEHYRVVKSLGDMQAWSYSFRVLDSEPGRVNGKTVRMLRRLDVAGVGPVTKAAGLGTRTTVIKARADGGHAPAILQGRLDALWTTAIEDRQRTLSARLAAMAPAAPRTVAEGLRARIERAMPNATAAYRRAVYAGEVADLVGQVAREDDRGGLQDAVIEADARGRVATLLRSTVGR